MPVSPLRVLIVDDSAFFRSIIKRALEAMPIVTVVGSASDGNSALKAIDTLRPDIVTLDVEMPGMDGLETLSRLSQSRQSPTVIMVSALTTSGAQITLKALELGAFDFITKPKDSSLSTNLKTLTTHLSRLIQCPQSSKQQAKAPRALPPRSLPRTRQSHASIEAIAIGISTGGPKALSKVLPQLCRHTQLPILIVQHMPPVFTAELSKSLNLHCPFTVVEAKDGDEIQPEHVYIAPGGKQMKVEKAANQNKLIRVTDDPEENFCRPSVDYLFRSIATHYGKHALGVIMTGIGSDGTLGLKAMKQVGARTIAQEPNSCTVYGMPRSAIEADVIDDIVDLDDIANFIASLTNARAH